MTNETEQFKGSIDAGRLRRCVEALAAVVGDACLAFEADGLVVRAMDESSTAFVSFRLGKGEFETYRPAEGAKVGVHLGGLAACLRRMDGEAIVELTVADVLTVKGRADGRTQAYHLPVLADVAERPEPALKFAQSRPVEAAKLREALKDLRTAGDAVCRISVERDCIRMRSESELARAEVELPQPTPTVQAFEGEGSACSSTFSFKLLEKALASRALASELMLEMGNDHPMRLGFESGGTRFHCVIAPNAEA